MNLNKKEKIVKYSLIVLVLIAFLIYFFIDYENIIIRFNDTFIKSNNSSKLFTGLLNTFLMSIAGLIIGIILGMLTCLIQGIHSKNIFVLIIKQIVNFYVSIFRGTPVAVQLLIIYFIIFASFNGDPLYIAILAFGLNSGAYVSEIIRGGINSIPKGQLEAGRSLGLSYSKTMSKIILPQAIKNVLPSLGNEFIALIKETSVAGFIGAMDLTLAFRQIGNASFDIEISYIVMGITYFIIIFVFTKLLTIFERRLAKSDRT